MDQRAASHALASTSSRPPCLGLSYGVLRNRCRHHCNTGPVPTPRCRNEAAGSACHTLASSREQVLSNGSHHLATNGASREPDTSTDDGKEYLETQGGGRIPLMLEERTETDCSTNKELISHSHSIASFFNADDWEYHQTSDRYFRNLLNIGTSTVFRRTLPPCLMVTAFAAAVALYNTYAVLGPHQLPVLAMGSVPHTILGSALSLLLVFRTNSSYGRLVEGRRMWGQVVRSAREWVRLATVYFPPQLHPEALALIQAFAIVLKGKVRPGRTRADPADDSACRYDTSAKLRRVLGPGAAGYVLSVRNPPGAVARALSRVLQKAADWPQPIPLFTAQRCEDVIRDLVTAASGCDRLFQTPIPVSYTRHTARSLMLWLMTLPMALWPVMGCLVVPVTFFCSYVLIGIDELGVQIEEPSAILPLVPLLNKIRFEIQAAVREVHGAVEYAV